VTTVEVYEWECVLSTQPVVEALSIPVPEPKQLKKTGPKPLAIKPITEAEIEARAKDYAFVRQNQYHGIYCKRSDTTELFRTLEDAKCYLYERIRERDGFKISYCNSEDEIDLDELAEQEVLNGD
jgi:hypothetical protein